MITARSGRVLAVEDIHRHLEDGKSLVTPLDLFACVSSCLAERLESIILDIAQDTDELEDRLFEDGRIPSLDALHDLRRKVFRTRRLLTTLRHVLTIIVTDPTLEIDSDDKTALMKFANHVTLHLENLEDLRARAQILQDQIDSRLANIISRSSFNLSIVATVFLPLTFVSGLLGMNVAGIPDTHNPWGFWVVTGVLLFMAVGLWIALYWRMRN